MVIVVSAPYWTNKGRDFEKKKKNAFALKINAKCSSHIIWSSAIIDSFNFSVHEGLTCVMFVVLYDNLGSMV